MGCIYKLTSPSGKSYIGATAFALEKRLLEHQKAAATNKRTALYAAVRKYGFESFAIQLLAVSDDWDELCALESAAIAAHGTLGPCGYNMTTGGDGVHGLIAEARARHRANTAQGTTRAWQSGSLRDTRAAAFSTQSFKEKHAKATSAGVRAAFARSETQEAIRQSRTQPAYRRKVAASVKALWADPLYRARMVAARRQQKPRTEESRQRQSVKMKQIIADRKLSGTYWHSKDGCS